MFGEKTFRAHRRPRGARARARATISTRRSRSSGPTRAAWLETYCNGFNAGAAKRGTPALLRLLGRPRRDLHAEVDPHRLPARLVLRPHVDAADRGDDRRRARRERRAARGLRRRSSAMPPTGSTSRGCASSACPTSTRSSPARRSAAPTRSRSRARDARRRARSSWASSTWRSVAFRRSSTRRTSPTPTARSTRASASQASRGTRAVATEHVAFSCTFGHADNVDIVAERCKDGSTSSATSGGRSRAASSACACAVVASSRSGRSTTASTARPRRRLDVRASIRACAGAASRELANDGDAALDGSLGQERRGVHRDVQPLPHALAAARVRRLDRRRR